MRGQAAVYFAVGKQDFIMHAAESMLLNNESVIKLLIYLSLI